MLISGQGEYKYKNSICENMLGSVMCSGGSVYGVFAGGGERKSRCAVSGGLCACGHCGGERYYRGAYGQVCSGDGDDHRQGAF